MSKKTKKVKVLAPCNTHKTASQVEARTSQSECKNKSILRSELGRLAYEMRHGVSLSTCNMGGEF